MKKLILNSLVSSFVFVCWLFIFWIIWYRVYSAALQATSGTPLTAWNWNDMVKNFFWWSGSGWIYYNGKVWIGTNAPNKDLHIYDTINNAEIDIQSVSWAWKHWWIYQNATTQNLHMRNSSDRLIITTGWNLNVWWTVNAWGTLNAAWWVCMNWDCKTAWNQVSWWWFLNYTWTCDSAHKWATGIFSWVFKVCSWIDWNNIVVVISDWTSSSTPWITCNTIKTKYGATTSWLYRLDPNWWSTVDSFQAYCDMTTEWGWRTLLWYAWDNTAWFPNLSTTVWAYNGTNRTW